MPDRPSPASTSGEIRLIVSKLAKGRNTLEVWDELLSLKLGGTEFAEARNEFLVKLVQEDGLDSALEFALGKFGPGTTRQESIAVLFAHAKEPKSVLLARLEAFDSPRDRESAKDGLLWEDVIPDDFIALPRLSKEGADLYLIKMAHQAQREGKKSTAKFEEAFRSHLAELTSRISSEWLPSSAVDSYLTHCASNNPFEIWKFSQDGELAGLAINHRITDALAEAMITSNPQKAVDEFSRCASPNSALASRALLAWFRSDPNAANQWFAENKANLNSNIEDSYHFASAIHSASGERADYNEAWEALSKIDDAAMRRKAEGEIWTRESQEIRRRSETNPSEIIEELVSGNSQHAPYWIETVMNEWVAQDSDAAWSWYEDNQRKLTPQQNEAVALTYARLALKDGDVDVASQWAAHVVTPKFKDKIAVEIEAAGR